ncbi:hypothetical protein Taro_045909 [Colocasia esculenta]|uniref:Uncharacterized protein n=1 Tax=Colocasia esculenta TaxID=4460 RepID=A0A843X162_COLES|nr:hypothetical protein [Colocasia esculenta]
MFVVLRARRRWSFRREGPNGSALLVEVGTLVLLSPKHAPLPPEIMFFPVSFARCSALESLSRERLLSLPGTPIPVHLLREYSGWRACSSRETSQQRQGVCRAEEIGR